MNYELTTIKLYGDMGNRFGRVHRLAVGSVAEAIRALSVTVHGFQAYLTNAKDRGVEFAVRVEREVVTKNDLQNPTGRKVIRIAPVLKGSKRNGVLQTIAGIVLVVVGAIAMYFGQAWGVTLIQTGIGMIAGGIVQMLTPVPRTDQNDRKDDRTSYVFNGAVNVQAQGACVPVLYGELIIGSVVISAGIGSEDNYVTTVPNPPGGPGPGSGEFNGGDSYDGNVIDERAEA